MTTFALALILFGLLMIYCGVKSKSLRSALVGHAVDTSTGSLFGSSSSGQRARNVAAG